MQPWFVNKQGMISIYALILLSITLCFLSYLTVVIQTQYKQRILSLVDIYTIHYVKHQIENIEYEQLKEKQEVINWDIYQLTFYYMEEHVHVIIENMLHHYDMYIYFDQYNKRLIDYTYSNKNKLD